MTAEAQVGTRELAPPIPASVEAPVRARAAASDILITAGDLDGALSALWPGVAPRNPPTEGLEPRTPEWMVLRRLAAAPVPPESQEELLALTERLLGSHTTGAYETAWRAARIAMAQGILAPRAAERRGWLRWGILWGMEAVLLDPDPLGTESRFWLLANLGQLALNLPPTVERGRASEAVFDLAQSILAVDPDHAGAHITLGRNHLEVRSQNLAARTLARLAYGNQFVSRSTFDGAMAHLERGALLDPGMIFFQMEWAHGLWVRGERDSARRVWRTVETLPLRLPIDAALKAEARRRLVGGE